MSQIKITLTTKVMLDGKVSKAGTTLEANRLVALDLIARNRAVEFVAEAEKIEAEKPKSTKKAKVEKETPKVEDESEKTEDEVFQ